MRRYIIATQLTLQRRMIKQLPVTYFQSKAANEQSTWSNNFRPPIKFVHSHAETIRNGKCPFGKYLVYILYRNLLIAAAMFPGY